MKGRDCKSSQFDLTCFMLSLFWLVLAKSLELSVVPLDCIASKTGEQFTGQADLNECGTMLIHSCQFVHFDARSTRKSLQFTLAVANTSASLGRPSPGSLPVGPSVVRRWPNRFPSKQHRFRSSPAPVCSFMGTRQVEASLGSRGSE
jgi:hypothetical protein